MGHRQRAGRWGGQRAALLLVLVGMSAASDALACVRAERLTEATGALRESLELIDGRCRAGLALLAQGRGAEALPYLKGALARPELLDQDLTLPLAEAFFSAGAPAEVSLLAFEAARLMPRPPGPEGALIDARLAELVYGLGDGEAAALLARAAGRPAADLLSRRAEADARQAEPPPPATAGVAALLPLSGKLESAGRRVLDGLLLGLGADERVLVVDTNVEPASLAVDALARQGAGAILGPVDRAAVEGVLAAAGPRQLPVVRLDVAGPADGSEATRVFRMGPSRGAELAAAVAEARRRGATRFADRKSVV